MNDLFKTRMHKRLVIHLHKQHTDTRGIHIKRCTQSRTSIIFFIPSMLTFGSSVAENLVSKALAIALTNAGTLLLAEADEVEDCPMSQYACVTSQVPALL